MNPRKNSNKTNAIFLILGGLIGTVSFGKSGLAHQFMYGISPKYISSSTSQYTIIAKIPMTCSGYILATGGIQA